MTTFQALIYAIVHGMSEFFPISAKAHQVLLPYLVGWQPPTGALLGALTFGSFMALLVFFRHDWASMISCFLQVIIFRKRPMTLDERMPLFLAITLLPVVFASYYFHEKALDLETNPLLVAGVLAASSLPLWFADSVNRKTKGMFDWNWLNAAVVGIVQASALVPGWDCISAILLGAFLLNFKREPAAKYAYFALTPLLFARSVSFFREIDFHASAPMPDLSWLSFGVALVVTFFVGLLTIGGFMKHLQQKGVGRFIAYRWAVGLAVFVVYWFRTRA
jgi:undecaprenyl-diphosphatase